MAKTACGGRSLWGRIPRNVIAISLGSRVLVLILQLVFNLVVPDHKSRDAFRTSVKSQESMLDNLIVDHLFEGMNHWDGQYYTHIAKYGYDSEDKLVFLPVYPLCLRGLAHVVQRLTFGVLSSDSCIILSSITINTCFFVISSILLYNLTLKVFHLRDHEDCTASTLLRTSSFAEETVSWFCFNPASVFFSGNYTESLYSMVTFAGLLSLSSNGKVIASAVFALSSLIRSNGILNSGFLAFQALRMLMSRKFTPTFIYVFFASLSVIPFVVYQRHYILSHYCPAFAFCSDPRIRSWHSLPYSLLQEKYWNQGFLKYYQIKQIPNFVLSFPMFFLVFGSFYKFITRQSRKIEQHPQNTEELFLTTARLLPFALHALFIAVYSLLFTHVQVFTRMMASSSPWIYWYAASLASEESSRLRKLVKLFFTLYFFVGIAMFANGLPWT